MSSNYSEVQKWAYSRRIQQGEAFDCNKDDFFITTKNGRVITAKAKYSLDTLTMQDFLPILVSYKMTSNGFVIIDFELEDHASMGDQAEQQDLDSYMEV